MSAWQFPGSALENHEYSPRIAFSYVQATRMDTENRAWREAAAIILGGSQRPQDVTYALIAWRAHLMAGHPVLRLLEAYRDVLNGERSALTDEELAPLRERAA